MEGERLEGGGYEGGIPAKKLEVERRFQDELWM
jgi:hypothetical protein